MNKPVYLGLSVLDISKIAIYENWYDYIKPKCKDMTKPCYTEPGRVQIDGQTINYIPVMN